MRIIKSQLKYKLCYNLIGDNMYADVLVSLDVKKNDQRFTYLIGDFKVEVGMRVKVPFGNRSLEGFVLKIHSEKPDFELKQIKEVIDEKPVLTEELLRVGYYMSKKTLSSLIMCYQTMLPKALKADINTKVNIKYNYYYELIDDSFEPLNEPQRKIVELLKEGKKDKKIIDEISSSAPRTLIKKGAIKLYSKEVYRGEDYTELEDCKITLNENQEEIVDSISSELNKFKPILIHGVTGSGKTEVYMNVIKKVVDEGKQVIMLVPEISLTPQMVCIFKKRFSKDVAILHSGLSIGEKYDEWRKIEREEAKIVIGARSAIFAPFKNLGLIVIDEEHSSTYKQENSPNYYTHDIALFRGKEKNIPVIFGSATPSLETYTRALTGEFELFSLKERVKNIMPKTIVVDMKDEIKNNNRILSKILKEKIQERLGKDEQVILLLNRRGYSTTSICSSCYTTLKCPRCDIPLTYHKVSNDHKCHYCNYKEYSNPSCKSCGGRVLTDYGLGTQKLEEHLNEVFKDAKVARLDQDSTSKKHSLSQILNDFKNKKFNILIGTQMIAKGLDFNDVTLVGVLNADASLNIPDFRSAERTFQLISQVSGRSGRDLKSGEVVIQTFNKEHYSITYAKNHDYIGFYDYEMNLRKKLKYPPYFNVCVVKGSSKNLDYLTDEMNKIKNYLNSDEYIILGPANSNMAKVKNMYNVQIIIKYKKFSSIKDKLEFIKNKYEGSNKVRMSIDVNALYL